MRCETTLDRDKTEAGRRRSSSIEGLTQPGSQHDRAPVLAPSNPRAGISANLDSHQIATCEWHRAHVQKRKGQHHELVCAHTRHALRSHHSQETVSRSRQTCARVSASSR